jgi:dTDP-4-amino-4,6-dideoxygalactose transaminase
VCVDLIAAARKANVRVRLYDVDPQTLSPDLDSVRRVLAEGVHAVTVVHLYGFPADVAGVRTLALEFGIPVIEDAAQQAGATLHARRAGSLGDITILSFGRGKGTTSGNGGALLAHDERWTDAVHAADPSRAGKRISRGARDMIGATASWLLGRPSIYNIPSSIPALHLGETVYHDAGEPAPLSQAAAALLRSSLASADTHIAIRRRNTAMLHAAMLHAATPSGAPSHANMYPCTVIEGGESGYLRFPVLTDTTTEPAPELGIVRGYPRALSDQQELYPLLQQSRESLSGAHELTHRLMTLPTHHLMTGTDLNALCAWLRPS